MPVKGSSISSKPLKIRKRAKQKKPEFLRSESWRYSKLSESWRRPRGLDHKMRRKIKGWPPMVSTGYKGPKIARGLHPSGLREVLVHNIDEIENVDPKGQVARIAHTVGKKKRAFILAEAKKKKILVLNPGIEETAEEPVEQLEGEKSLIETEETKAEKSEKPKRPLLKRKIAEEKTRAEKRTKRRKEIGKSVKSEKGTKEP